MDRYSVIRELTAMLDMEEINSRQSEALKTAIDDLDAMEDMTNEAFENDNMFIPDWMKKIPLDELETFMDAIELTDAIEKAIKAIELEKADGCQGCAFEDREEWELPCDRCKRAKKDYWRGKA